jgi:hypothetical protein
VLTAQRFARKVFHRTSTSADIMTEVVAVDKLRGAPHPNILEVSQVDKLPDSCYYLDMELCEFNLHN